MKHPVPYAYVPAPGESIDHAAEQLVLRAQKLQYSTSMSFNGVKIAAAPGDKASYLVRHYFRVLNRRRGEYEASPEGKAALAERQCRIDAARAQVASSMLSLRALDFTNTGALIAWLHEIQDATDTKGSDTPATDIIKAFTSHGYEVSANCGDGYHAEDKENAARYLIGQALSGLQHIGAIHPIFRKFADEWRVKFGDAA